MEYDDTIYENMLAAIDGADSPDYVVDVFTRLVNALLGPQVIDGERRTLRPEDVEHSAEFGASNLHVGGNMFGENIGALFRGGKTYVGLLVNYRWWDVARSEAKLVFLVHEISHLEQQNRLDKNGHGKTFWDINLELYKEAKRQYALVEALFGSPFDWDRADWYFMTMPTILNIDHSEECVPERRTKYAEALGHCDSFDAFELMSEDVDTVAYEETELVTLDTIESEFISDKELFSALSEWLNRQQSQVWIDSETLKYKIEPPTVSETTDGYQVLVGERRVALLKRTLGSNQDAPIKIPVQVVDDKSPM